MPADALRGGPVRRGWFRLVKWYADCVTADGVAFVGYAARARLGPLVIPYQSILVSRPDAPPVARLTLRPGPGPRIEDGRVSWRAPRLGVDATWTATAPPLHRVLYEDARCLVDWRCHVPAAHSSALFDGAAPLVGDGYVEELVVAGDPRRVPIRELRWGRFSGDGQHLTWIFWQGQRPLALVFDGREERTDGRASEDAVSFAGGRLSYGASRTLRTGRIGRTFLAAHPLVARLLPRALDLHEEKWVSRARLEGPGARVATGWAIHEVVRWP